jgi:HK97 family phage major capsid protein
MTDSRRIIEKADLAVSQMIADGGYLEPEQSDTFFRKLIDRPTLINQVRTVSMGRPKMNIDKIGFGSRILRAAPASGTSLKADERARPTFDQVQLDTEEVIAEVHVPYDALEDSIEKENLQDTIMDHIAQRASLDLEELLIKGDTTSNDTYLALFNGALALAGNTVDGSAYTAIDKTMFKTALQNMPTQYLRNLNTMQFMMSYNNVFEYRDQLADRDTGKGDDFYLNRPSVFAFGVPIAPAALMEDTDMLFTFPKNLIFGVQRDIMIETDKDIRSRVLIIVLTMRIALEIEEAEAAVRVSDLAVV